ncbi:MAG: transcriptional repressor [Proteobacteria bacterium]|nr:transcriptional repressor [Pseudomonadota bacterium]
MTPPKYRLSKQRKVILEELMKVTSHPTADEVYDMVRTIIPRISLGTVYRNLEFLCSQGLAIKVGPAGSQKRFDANPNPHPHIRCEHCGKVEDVHEDVVIPSLSPGSTMGYELTGCSVEFVGICPSCAAVNH